MIVIGVIGILAAALFPSLSSYLSRGRDTAKISEIKQLNTALISYQVDKSTFSIPWVWYNLSWSWWINFVNGTTYVTAIATKLWELGYLEGNITHKIITDLGIHPVPTSGTPTNPCYNSNGVPVSWDLYMFYADNVTGQYSISGYLENPKQADIDNAVLAYSMPLQNICTKYGRNYVVWKN